ncbi:hypothetical protein GCM10023156_39660 [Novipirellula rosea]|uniref:DUF4372 domain-containing protein n=1 Tax=Novipirellula rosea TaxID=1031540 RepID=A0ABP8N1L7_9BACT
MASSYPGDPSHPLVNQTLPVRTFTDLLAVIRNTHWINGKGTAFQLVVFRCLCFIIAGLAACAPRNPGTNFPA